MQRVEVQIVEVKTKEGAQFWVIKERKRHTYLMIIRGQARFPGSDPKGGLADRFDSEESAASKAYNLGLKVVS
jgi:hypothetical protein